VANYTPALKRWLVHLSLPQAGGSALAVAGIELRTTIGGSNVATTGANTRCHANGSNPANAVDGDPATRFSATEADTWWGYISATDIAVAQVAITARNDSGWQQAPTAVAIWGMDDNDRMYLLADITGLTWSSAQSRTFNIGTLVQAHQQFRLEASTFGSGAYVPITEPPPASLPLKYSTVPAKTGAQPLAGASNLTGDIFVFLDSDPAVTQIAFWIDSATPSAPAEAPDHSENFAPWDLLGTASTAPYDPIAFDLTALSDGSHVISTRLTYGGVVQPVYTTTFTVHNAASSDPITFKVGPNRGTSLDPNFFVDFDAWFGRPSRTTTVNALMYTLAELARGPSGSYGWKYWKQLTPTTGTYVDYWTVFAGDPSDMLLNIQISPCSTTGIGMFARVSGTSRVTDAAQAQCDALMMSQINGGHDSLWQDLGRSHATRGRTRANTIINLGHEFNGTWYPYTPRNIGNANWIAMFRRAVQQYRIGYLSILPAGQPPRIAWCYGANKDPLKGNDYSVGPSVWACYPGDDVVDVIGVHHYDFAHWSLTSDWTTMRAWQNSIATAADQARARGRELYCGEFNIINAASPDAGTQRGPGPAQDNPTFFQLMYNWAIANRFQNNGVTPLLIGMSLFQSNSGTSSETKYIFPVNNGATDLDSRNSVAGAKFKELFGLP
jgi:hypothetical protein